MRKADRETESRKLIGEKLRKARMADNSPMTEEDAEYYRILAEARATHAAKENSCKSAKRHVLTSAAAILLILAVAGGSFILGMQSDVRASADPDDERKVVQQGDNIVIGSGVSEDDENVGVVTKTYYSLEDVPEDVKFAIPNIEHPNCDFRKVKITYSQNLFRISTYYKDKAGNEVEVSKEWCFKEGQDKTIILNVEDKLQHEKQKIYLQQDSKGYIYMLELENCETLIFISKGSEIKIEDILDDLHIKTDLNML